MTAIEFHENPIPPICLFRLPHYHLRTLSVVAEYLLQQPTVVPIDGSGDSWRPREHFVISPDAPHRDDA
jgi:hypothetical protein